MIYNLTFICRNVSESEINMTLFINSEYQKLGENEKNYSVYELGMVEKYLSEGTEDDTYGSLEPPYEEEEN